MSDRRMGACDHAITHRRPPREWHDGLPLGNGDIGVMFWGDGDPLALTLDKSDLWDLRSNTDYMGDPRFSYAELKRLVAEGRFDEVNEVFEQRQRRDNPVTPTKTSLGRVELRLGEATEYDCSLRLGSGAVEGVIRTREGAHGVCCFVHRERNVVCLRAEGAPRNARVELTALSEMDATPAELRYPGPEREVEGDRHTLVQTIPDGLSHAVAWNVVGPDFLIAVETADSPEEARAAARQTFEAALGIGFEELHREHAQAWETFWAASAVHLPERRMELLWYLGVYLLGSSARRGCAPPGLQGVWAMDGVPPPWRGDYHADMNVQETFWPACVSGHLDLLDSWCDLMRDSIPAVREFTRRFFGTEGTFWICATLPEYTIAPGWHTAQFAWSNSGWLAWLVWLRWRHSLDVEWLRETGYPVVAGIFGFYRANVEEQADRRLHIPLSSSPEYRDNKPEAWCEDPSIDIALIRRCCDWVIEMESALGRSDLTAAAQELRDDLAPYPLTDGNVLCLCPGRPLDESHRHPSQLMAVHPAMDLTIEGGEEARAIIAASVDQYLSLGRYLWAGHTHAQLASLAAVIGRAELAYDCLLSFAEYWIGQSGLHFNRDLRNAGVTAYRGADRPFTMEANCGIAAGIGDMLVQGWGDIVRVFPAVPDHWRDVAFRDLLAEGAFRVSAVRGESRTVWVHVRATVGRTLRLRDPFGEEAAESAGPPVRREGDDFVADLEEGETLTLWASDCPVPGEPGEAIEQAAQWVRDSDTSRIGLPRGIGASSSERQAGQAITQQSAD